MEIFRTERLIARAWSRDDAEAAFAIYGDPRVMQHIGNGVPRASLEEQRAALERTIAEGEKHRGRMGSFALVERASGALVGAILLKPLPDSSEIEIGWHLGHAAWGKGYASEAARAMLEHARGLGLKRVLAVAQPANGASLRVMEKIGMTREGLTTRYYGRELELYAIDLE
jgi:ribosomal-protein-alanine N-acetyltransferase